MSVTLSSRKAALSLSLPVTGDFFRLLGIDAELLRRNLDVLVAATREVQDEVLTSPQLTGHLLGVGDGMRSLERRDNSLEPGTQGKSTERLLVGDARVLGEAFVPEVGVLGARRRVVEAGGDRVRLPDLTAFGLQHVAQGAVQNPKLALRERGPVLARRESPARGFHPDEPHALASDKRVKGADGVGPRPDARDDGVRVSAEALLALYLDLPADNRLEVAHDPGVRARTDDAPDDVVCVLDASHPVPYGLVHRVLEGARATRDGHHLRAEQLHPHDVQPLAAGVLLAHVDDALLPVERRHGGGRDAVLAGAGLGDDAGFAHPVGEQDLPQGVVYLVRPRVREVLPLEPHVSTAPPLREPLGEHEGRRATYEVPREGVQLFDELGVVLVAVVGLLQLFEGVDQGLRHVPPPERPEVPPLNLLPHPRTSEPARHSSCPASLPGSSRRPPHRARSTRSPPERSRDQVPRRRGCYHAP